MINTLRQTINHKIRILAGFLLLLLIAEAHAEVSPEKIFINADRMQLNIESGYSEYSGQVKISQGELVLDRR